MTFGVPFLFGQPYRCTLARMDGRRAYRLLRKHHPGKWGSRRRWRLRWVRDLTLGLVLIGAISLAQPATMLAPSWLASAEEPAGDGARLRVIDGDTFEVIGTGERVRLANIDTPETGGRERCDAERRAGERATGEVRRLIREADRVSVRRTGREDRYGRTIGFVEVDGRDIGRLLMDAGLARPWRGRREPWCAANGRLLP